MVPATAAANDGATLVEAFAGAEYLVDVRARYESVEQDGFAERAER
jgi:hypothetical protein